MDIVHCFFSPLPINKSLPHFPILVCFLANIWVFFGLSKEMGDLVLAPPKPNFPSVENSYVMGIVFLLDPFTSVTMLGDHLKEVDV